MNDWQINLKKSMIRVDSSGAQPNSIIWKDLTVTFHHVGHRKAWVARFGSKLNDVGYQGICGFGLTKKQAFADLVTKCILV